MRDPVAFGVPFTLGVGVTDPVTVGVPDRPGVGVLDPVAAALDEGCAVGVALVAALVPAAWAVAPLPPMLQPTSETTVTDVLSNAFHDLVIECATPSALCIAGAAELL